MSKKKLPQIRIELPEQAYLNHFTTALSIANAYRMARGENLMSLERFGLNCMVEASNALLQFQNDQQQKQLAEQQAAAVEAADEQPSEQV